ncbi:MAG: DUF1801 domain-containing protein [Flavobacteriales bacterium]|nr:DUF1801 domain-containing protein [Flavobacteriales bacterium]
MPDCKEKLAYNVTFYHLNRRVCFIWPASIQWGKTKHQGVNLGFCSANLMQDEINYLGKGTCKEVYWKTFNDVSEIDVDIVRTYLFEAVDVDRKYFSKK